MVSIVFIFQRPSIHVVQRTCSTSSIFQAGPREDAFSVRGEGVWYLWSKYSYLVGFVPAPLRRPEGGRLFVRQERSVVLAPTNIPATLGWNIHACSGRRIFHLGPNIPATLVRHGAKHPGTAELLRTKNQQHELHASSRKYTHFQVRYFI